jgi:hypothetical protein
MFAVFNFGLIEKDPKNNLFIARVFECIDMGIFLQCINFYGNGKGTRSLLNTKCLSELQSYLARKAKGKPFNEFRCNLRNN